MEAVKLALERANESLADGRIPISGAAVELTKSGKLKTVTIGSMACLRESCPFPSFSILFPFNISFFSKERSGMALSCVCSDEGHNGRIPPLSGQSGYPTDHGETAAIREIKDVSKIAWSRVVFATTLSPCIMCSSALKWLWKLGLRRVVVAESSSFAGATLLDELDGMTVVRLSNLKAQSMMKTFSTHYPWDWAADIGEIPPGDLTFSQSLETADELEEFLKQMHKEMKPGHQAAVVSSEGILASAEDERPQSGGNETRSAAMIAMGSAGSQVNLRECVLFFRASDHSPNVNLDEFGAVSMGACKLFKPAKVVLTASPTDELN